MGYDDTYDDYIDYDYTGNDNNNDNINANNSPDIIMATRENDKPYFEQTSVRVFTDPNKDVILNCDVRNFHGE